jgi:hypothetical protein
MTSDVTTHLYRVSTYRLQGNQARQNIKSFGVYTKIVKVSNQRSFISESLEFLFRTA